jgi:hypothetical protein
MNKPLNVWPALIPACLLLNTPTSQQQLYIGLQQTQWHSRSFFNSVRHACDQAAAVPAAGHEQPACKYQQAPTVPSL